MMCLLGVGTGSMPGSVTIPIALYESLCHIPNMLQKHPYNVVYLWELRIFVLQIFLEKFQFPFCVIGLYCARSTESIPLKSTYIGVMQGDFGIYTFHFVRQIRIVNEE